MQGKPTLNDSIKPTGKPSKYDGNTQKS